MCEQKYDSRNLGLTLSAYLITALSCLCTFSLLLHNRLSLSLSSVPPLTYYLQQQRSQPGRAAATPPTTNITYVTAWKLISSSLPSLVWPLCLLLLSYTYTIHTHPRTIQQGNVDTNCGAHSIRSFSGWGNFNDMENHSHYEEECGWASWR